MDEDSSITQDDSPKIKRKKTIIKKLTHRKRSTAPQSGNLSGKFLTNFMEMAKDLEKGEKGENGPGIRKGSTKKRSKNAKKAMERLEQNKDMVLNKAHVIKSRWQRLAKASKWDSTGEKWGSLLRLAMGQSRTSLNTISEDDKRNSWVRGMNRMARSNSEFSINTLPDIGSWSMRNSYAEPILNIITDQLENVDHETGRDIAQAQKKPETEVKTTVEINNVGNLNGQSASSDPLQRQENVYDKVEEPNSDSETDSVYDDSDLSNSQNSSTTKGSKIELRTLNQQDKTVSEDNGDTHL